MVVRDAMNDLGEFAESLKRRSRNGGRLLCSCRGLGGQAELLDTIRVVTSRSGEYTKVVLEKREGCVREFLLETFHDLGVGEYIPAVAGHVVEELGEVNLYLTLVDVVGGHGIVIFTEQFFLD